MSSGNVQLILFKTLIAAGILGAGAALLLAPRTGKQTRNILSRKTSRLRNQSLAIIERAKRKLSGNKTTEIAFLGIGEGGRRIRYDGKIQTPILTHWEREI